MPKNSLRAKWNTANARLANKPFDDLFGVPKNDEPPNKGLQSDGAKACPHTWSLVTVEGFKCIECGHITPRS